jgi:hypothetical protein
VDYGRIRDLIIQDVIIKLYGQPRYENKLLSHLIIGISCHVLYRPDNGYIVSQKKKNNNRNELDTKNFLFI